jgi:hypothetical protein
MFERVQIMDLSQADVKENLNTFKFANKPFNTNNLQVTTFWVTVGAANRIHSFHARGVSE